MRYLEIIMHLSYFAVDLLRAFTFSFAMSFSFGDEVGQCSVYLKSDQWGGGPVCGETPVGN